MSSVAIEERHFDLEQEPVELRFGERIRPFLLDRVLRGHHEERLLQLVDRAGRGDRAFLHRFEQGRLRLRRGAVDFVGQQELGEDRPRPELEFVAARSALVVMIRVPMMSAGIRSGVNWMRRKSSSSTRDRALTSSVLPRPGTPSSSTLPPQKMAVSVASTTRSWPTITGRSPARAALKIAGEILGLGLQHFDILGDWLSR